MQVSLFAVDVEDKCFASGTVYTPDGIRAVNQVFNSCDEVFEFMPTFATFLTVKKIGFVNVHPYDDYYLRFSNVESLKRMLIFMVGESSAYLTFIPQDTLKTLGVDRITHVVPSYSLPCRFTGSIPAIFTFSRDHVFINNFPVAEITPDNYIKMCSGSFKLDKPIRDYVKEAISSLLACYVVLYPGEINWSTVVRLWCGAQIM